MSQFVPAGAISNENFDVATDTYTFDLPANTTITNPAGVIFLGDGSDTSVSRYYSLQDPTNLITSTQHMMFYNRGHNIFGSISIPPPNPGINFLRGGVHIFGSYYQTLTTNGTGFSSQDANITFNGNVIARNFFSYSYNCNIEIMGDFTGTIIDCFFRTGGATLRVHGNWLGTGSNFGTNSGVNAIGNTFYFHGNIGATAGMDFPSNCFTNSANSTIHALSSKATNNLGGMDGDLLNAQLKGVTIIFDL